MYRMKSRRTSCVFFALRSVPVFILVLLLLRPSLITAQDSTNVVVQWNNAALQGVRDSKLGPPMVARALAIVHTCIYDAWAAYDDRARGTQFGGQLRRPQNERMLANKNQAISFAAYRALMDLMPLDRASVYDPLMASLGSDPNVTSTDVTKPSGIGNVVCGAALSFRHFDGSNQLNNYVGVGFIEPHTPDRALLWRNGTRIDFNTLIPEDSGYHLIMAFDVNARGEIVVCAV